MYYVYILQSTLDGSYYIGYTSNPIDRLVRHNRGFNKSTRYKRPWKLVYCEEFETRKEAMRKELYIKNKKKRNFIENLIRGGSSVG